MRTLLSLLEDAAKRSAVEAVLESGQPVVFTTARGSEVEREVLPRTELFDMISAAVGSDQEVELAVGNPVSFEIDAGGSTWRVSAEPGMDGMRVQARRDASELEIALDASSRRLTLDGVLETEPLSPADTSSVLERGAIDPGPAAPYESGTWALDDEDDFDVELDEPNLPPRGGAAASGVPAPPEPSYDFQASDAVPLTTDIDALDLPPAEPVDDFIGVPADDDEDDEEFDPFSEPIGKASAPPPRAATPTPTPTPAPTPKPAAKPAPAAELKSGGTAKTVPAMSAASPIARPAAAKPSTGSSPQAKTRREISAVRSPEADTQRELPSVGNGAPELGDLAVDIPEGSLVYVNEPGFAETLTQSVQAPSLTVDDRVNPFDAWGRLRNMPTGAIIVVAREDPSEVLGWILRRLEEGYRVFVETRARSPEGARRCLLGLAASERAEAWLRAQNELVIEAGDAGPQVRPA